MVRFDCDTLECSRGLGLESKGSRSVGREKEARDSERDRAKKMKRYRERTKI